MRFPWREKYPIKNGLPLGHGKNQRRASDFIEIQEIIARLEVEDATGIEVRRGGGSFNYYVLWDKAG